MAANQKKPKTIQEQWNELECKDDIKSLPDNLQNLCRWVTSIARCVGGQPLPNDQIAQDSTKYVLEDYFERLSGGKLMDALGTNNDCLIHSFLTCVCPEFRRYLANIRSKIASFFRRFIMTQIPDADNPRLSSSSMLETTELTLLCKKFNVPFIIVKRGMYPVDRHMEIVPDDSNEDFWRNRADEETYYVIHGSGAHFTPVAWNNTYEIHNKRRDLDVIIRTIGQAVDDDRDVDEVRKQITEEAILKKLNEFDKEYIQGIRKQIRNAPTDQEKSEIINENIEGLGGELGKYINTLDSTYRKDYAGFIMIESIVSLLTGGANNAASAYAAQKDESKFEPDVDVNLEATIQASIASHEEEEKNRAPSKNGANRNTAANVAAKNESALQEALLRSLQDGIAKAVADSLQTAKVNANRTAQNKAQMEAAVADSLQTAKVNANRTAQNKAQMEAAVADATRRTIELIEPQLGTTSRGAVDATAKIGNDLPTTYKALLYKGNKVAVMPWNVGGKRKTKKSQRKNRKTKKLKK